MIDLMRGERRVERELDVGGECRKLQHCVLRKSPTDVRVGKGVIYAITLVCISTVIEYSQISLVYEAGPPITRAYQSGTSTIACLAVLAVLRVLTLAFLRYRIAVLVLFP